MAVHRALPAEGVVKQDVLRRRGQILAPAHDVRDSHEPVVDHVREIVCGIAVGLEQDLVPHLAVGHGDGAEDLVGVFGLSVKRDLLSDDVGLARGRSRVRLRGIDVPAVSVIPADPVRLPEALKALLAAEAAVGVSALYELLGVFAVDPLLLALALDVRTRRSSDARALVVFEPCRLQRLEDHVLGALDQSLPVGVLDAEDELSAGGAGDKVGVQRGAQVAYVHISGRRRREARHDLLFFSLSLRRGCVLYFCHIFYIFVHKGSKLLFYVIIHTSFFPV